MAAKKKTAVQQPEKSTQDFPFVDLCNINVLLDDKGINSAGVDFDTGRHPSHNSLQGNESLEIHHRQKVYEITKSVDPESGRESWFHEDLPIFAGNIEYVGTTSTGKKRWRLKLQMAKSAAK